jgi:formyltetrahydrofolate hydrolase
VLAKYMRVLTPQFVAKFPNHIIISIIPFSRRSWVPSRINRRSGVA